MGTGYIILGKPSYGVICYTVTLEIIGRACKLKQGKPNSGSSLAYCQRVVPITKELYLFDCLYKMGEDSFAQLIELITNVWHVIVNNTYKNDFNNTFRL